jgi:hypothetical protein
MNSFTQPGSAEWYMERYPGFYTAECYKVLEKWHKGVPDVEQITYPFGEKPKITISQKRSRKRKCQSLVCPEPAKPQSELSCIQV